MAKKKRSTRVIVLSDGINNESVGLIIQEIFDINYEDRDIEIKDREAIELVLNSGGGSCYDGWALIGAIEMSQTPVRVVVLGQAQSMGLLIAACGHYRIGSRHALFMYHGIAYGIKNDKIKHHMQELEQGQREQDQYNEMLAERTKIKIKFLDNAVRDGVEVYWSADDALRLGIIDEII